MKIDWLKSPSKRFMSYLAAWLLSLLLAPSLPSIIYQGGWYLFLSAGFLFIVGLIWRQTKRGMSLFCLAFFVLSLWRFSLALPINNDNWIAYYNGQKVSFAGVINGFPTINDNRQEVVVTKINFNGKFLSGDVITWLPRYPDYSPGDKLNLICKLSAPKIKDGFRYDQYLASKKIYSLCQNPKVEIQTKGEGFYFQLYRLQSILSDKIRAGLVDPEAGLAEAMTLGRQDSVSKEWLNIYSLSGIIHIISVSGFHMAVILWIMMTILLFLGMNRRMIFWLASSLIIFYVLLVGAPAAAIRSAVMAILALSALQLGQWGKPSNLLFAAAFLMTAINPWLAAADLSFQLSFLSLAGLIWLAEPLFLILEKILKKFNLNNKILRNLLMIISATLAAQLAVWPIAVNAFGRLSLIGLLANVVLAPLSSIWLTMIFASLALSFVFGQLFWLPTAVVGRLITGGAKFFAFLPLASVSFPKFPVWLIIFYYLLLWFVFIKKRPKKMTK